MIELRRILCPVDFSRTTAQGVEAGVSLATEFGAELVLLNVSEPRHPFLDDAGIGLETALLRERYAKRLELESARRLEQLAQGILPALAAVRTFTRHGVPLLEILEVVKEEAIDLIVIPTHARREPTRSFLGSLAQNVLQMAPCPVLTVPPGRGQQNSYPLSKVLHPTDLSDYSDFALPYARAISERCEAELFMLHVLTLGDHDPVKLSRRFPPVLAASSQAVEAAACRSLARHGRMPSSVLPAHLYVVRAFDPASAIVRFAEEKQVDLIVLATHGSTEWRPMLRDSTALNVVRLSSEPVLTIKHPEHEFVLP